MGLNNKRFPSWLPCPQIIIFSCHSLFTGLLTLDHLRPPPPPNAFQCCTLSLGFPVQPPGLCMSWICLTLWASFPTAQLVKNLPTMQETPFDSWLRKIHWRWDRLHTPVFLGFPCGSAGKESAHNTGDQASICGFGRFPGEGNGYPL